MQQNLTKQQNFKLKLLETKWPTLLLIRGSYIHVTTFPELLHYDKLLFEENRKSEFCSVRMWLLPKE